MQRLEDGAEDQLCTILAFSGQFSEVAAHCQKAIRTGKLPGPVAGPGEVFYPAISPDEKSVVFARIDGSGADLWLRDVARGTESRFTSDASQNFAPFWSPQGDRTAFASNPHGVFDLFQKAASGRPRDQVLLAHGNLKLPAQWSQDGRFIVYVEVDPKAKFHLWVLPMEGPEKERTSFRFPAERVQRIDGADLAGRLLDGLHVE